MRKKNYKGRCERQSLEKFTTICKTYDPIQTAYANILVENKDISEVRCNVILDGECSEYMTDFVCKKTDGDLMVRECIATKLLEKPLSIPRVKDLPGHNVGKVGDPVRLFKIRRIPEQLDPAGFQFFRLHVTTLPFL